MSKLNRRLSLYLQSLRFRVALPHTSGRVLDVGCNTGTLLERVHRVESYVGVDVDPECVRSIEEKRPGVEVYCADVQRESLPVAEPFDTLVAPGLRGPVHLVYQPVDLGGERLGVRLLATGCAPSLISSQSIMMSLIKVNSRPAGVATPPILR